MRRRNALQIEVDDATGVITDAKFKTFGLLVPPLHLHRWQQNG